MAFAWSPAVRCAGLQGLPSHGSPEAAVLWVPYCTLVLLSSFVAQPSLPPGASLLLHLCLHPQCYRPVIYSSCSRSSHSLPAALQVQGRGAAEVHSPPHSYNVVPETPKKMQTGRSEVAGPQAAVPLCPLQEPDFSRSEGCPAAAQPLSAPFCLHSFGLAHSWVLQVSVLPPWLAGPGECRHPCYQWLLALGPQCLSS